MTAKAPSTKRTRTRLPRVMHIYYTPSPDWSINGQMLTRRCSRCRATIPRGVRYLCVISHRPDGREEGRRRYCPKCEHAAPSRARK